MSDQAQARAFKTRMHEMAEVIAEAWPRFGRRATAEEQRSLEFIRDVLGVPTATGHSHP